jgi:uncharacterized protein YxjI
VYPALNRNLFLVKEHLGVFKAANNFDIYDPNTGALVLECREDRLNIITKLLRFTDWKRHTPFDIEIRTPAGEPVVYVRRGISLLLSRVDVIDGHTNQRIGGFQQRFFSVGGAFHVLDAYDNPVCHLKGNWTGWEFRFLKGEHELAKVTKKWMGVGKELLTSADNYILEISENVPFDSQIRQLILAAVMCIDMVLKE